ncbi:hypothetical protein ABA31_25900 [Agrococcus baldri]|uniref:Thioredoxin family protein n=1 Tax=Agrococcus baldri TaxID=153730 RepID=A0AA87UT26_9MICO|nr:hypothetical protein ABA31_25900 [Agrococcus baldri]
MMNFEVLTIEGCPHGAEATRRLEAALAADGRAAAVLQRSITTAADASSTAFAGSPTITFAGRDLFPSDGRTSALACRVYATPAGLASAPTVEQLRVAIGELPG